MKKRERIFPANDILEWARKESPFVRVETARDAVAGGLAMAMAPLIVGWNESSPGFGEDDFYLVHNVNIASNPVEGTTLLATARVPAGAVESVEFVTVMTKIGKVETEFGHVLLRFLFKEGRRPVILGRDGNPVTNNAVLRDLCISWEAWRPPGTMYDPLAGLDPSTYALTARCVSGPVRALADLIMDRPWTCYPLRLPEIEHAGDEILYVSLLLGDVIARQTIGGLTDRRIGPGVNLPDDYPAHEPLEAFDKAFQTGALPEDPFQKILDGKIRYHTLLRSCVTMALTSIDWANVRSHRRAGLPDPVRVRVTPDSLPEFFDELAHGKRSTMLMRLPATLHWLIQHQTAFPGKVPNVLDDAGLLQVRHCEIVKHSYSGHQTPYGNIADNLIY